MRERNALGRYVAEPIEQRFWAKIDLNGPPPPDPWAPISTGCWTWTASLTNGYGRIKVDGRWVFAHRLAYEALVGPIPEGLTLDHLCRVRACVRPDHLEPVTMRENGLRGDTIQAANARKTHCPYGHEYTSDNTYVYKGGRNCLACRTARDAARYKRERALGIR